VTGTQDIEDRGYCFWNGMRGEKVDGRGKKKESEVFFQKEWEFFKKGLFFFLA